MSTEEWRPVEGFPGYLVSSLGRVQSMRHGAPRILKGDTDGGGYVRIKLRKDRRNNYRSVHRLVLEAFIGPRPPGQVSRHIDDDKSNNRISNLAYGSHAENLADAIRNGRRRIRKPKPIRGRVFGSNGLGARLQEHQIPLIRAASANGETYDSIASRFGVSISTIWSVIAGQTWKYVPLNPRPPEISNAGEKSA
jgi:hypothetical protein